jgi:hypothetical protein
MRKAKDAHMEELEALQNEYATLSELDIAEGSLLCLGDLYKRLNDRNVELLANEVWHQKSSYQMRMEAMRERKRQRTDFQKVFNRLIRQIACLKMQLKLVGIEDGVQTRAMKRQRVDL